MFSIIIPTYNRLDSVINLVNSLSKQIKAGDEIIVIDDGSTDNTFGMLMQLPFEWLRVYQISNSGGPARPRNIGYHKAKNNWVCFLDSDDWWVSEKLYQLRNHLAGQEKFAAFSYHNAFGSKSKRIFGNHLYQNSDVYTFTRNPIVMSSLTVNKLFFDHDRDLFDERDAASSIEDTIFAYELCFNNMPYIYIDKCLSVYTEASSDSISQSHHQFTKMYLYHNKNPYDLHWINSSLIKAFWKTKSTIPLISIKNSMRKKRFSLSCIFYIPLMIIILFYTRIWIDIGKLPSTKKNFILDSDLQEYSNSVKRVK